MHTDVIIKYLEKWAPPGISWENDNTGLQIGSREVEVKNILLCLELNERIIDEAIKQNCNFIFTHHPFLFKPLSKIDTASDPKAQIIKKALKNDITVYSAHTNLDFTKDGVSYELAKVLGLKNIDFLVNPENNQSKIVVFVPRDSLSNVSESIFEAGGGIIGEYNKCSYRISGEGTFEGSENSDPAIGSKQNFETVEEIRLEVLADNWKLHDLIKAVLLSHPYEEPAFDVYPLKNENVNYGYGAAGILEKGLGEKEFLSYVADKLGTNSLRYTKGSGKKIRRVAVCGGSGSDLVKAAISSGADAYITADVKYHSFQEAEKKILYIDAGHFETEIRSLDAVKLKLEEFIEKRNKKIKVIKSKINTNPVRIFNKKGV